MNTPVSRRLLLLAPLAFGLSACGERAADPAPAPAQNPPAAAAAKPAPAKPAREYPADYAIDEAIPKNQIKTRLSVIGAPTYSAEDGMIDVLVRVTNDGKTALVGAGKMPVTLVIDGPGDDLTRKRLPLIPEGSAGRVKLRIPVADIGEKVKISLMQGGRSWAELFEQPVLELGPFKPCEDAAAGYCGADGKPLAAS